MSKIVVIEIDGSDDNDPIKKMIESLIGKTQRRENRDVVDAVINHVEQFKFDPDHDFENDPTRPVIGDVVDKDGFKYQIKYVQHFDANEVFEQAKAGQMPDKKGCDDILLRPHQSQHAFWALWVDEINED